MIWVVSGEVAAYGKMVVVIVLGFTTFYEWSCSVGHELLHTRVDSAVVGIVVDASIPAKFEDRDIVHGPLHIPSN